MNPSVRISWGELFDKITILEIKEERLRPDTARAAVQEELARLVATSTATRPQNAQIEALKAALKQVNGTLWDVENHIREKEAEKSFDAEFIELARAVYQNNDKRWQLKREIDILLNSELTESKQYSKY